MPFISIITVNLNNVAGLRQTLESIFSQGYKDVECLVIDGGSNDGSKQLMDQFAYKSIYALSEPDNGIYHAMNKGIAMAKGEWLLFLNSGDLLFNPRVLGDIVPQLDNQGIVYGDLMIKEPTKSWIKKYDQPLSFEYFTRDTLPHQGAFIHRKLFNEMGLYDESGILCADWQFFLEAVCRYAYPAKYLDMLIAIYDYTGLSSREDGSKRMQKEKEAILKREWAAMQSLQTQLAELRQKYNLLANSKVVKAYLAIRKKLGMY
jgi:glycosyltransferase involved in cell wall biosynthesis